MSDIGPQRLWNQVVTSGAPKPGGSYSQGAVVGNLLFTAGVGPHDRSSGEVVGSEIKQQTRQVFRNLVAILEEAGTSLENTVKVTAHLANLGRDFSEYDAVFAEVFTVPYPVRTTVGSELGRKLVEIDVVAALRR